MATPRRIWRIYDLSSYGEAFNGGIPGVDEYDLWALQKPGRPVIMGDDAKIARAMDFLTRLQRYNIGAEGFEVTPPHAGGLIASILANSALLATLKRAVAAGDYLDFFMPNDPADELLRQLGFGWEHTSNIPYGAASSLDNLQPLFARLDEIGLGKLVPQPHGFFNNATAILNYRSVITDTAPTAPAARLQRVDLAGGVAKEDFFFSPTEENQRPFTLGEVEKFCTRWSPRGGDTLLVYPVFPPAMQVSLITEPSLTGHRIGTFVARLETAHLHTGSIIFLDPTNQDVIPPKLLEHLLAITGQILHALDEETLQGTFAVNFRLERYVPSGATDRTQLIEGFSVHVDECSPRSPSESFHVSFADQIGRPKATVLNFKVDGLKGSELAAVEDQLGPDLFDPSTCRGFFARPPFPTPKGFATHVTGLVGGSQEARELLSTIHDRLTA